MKMLKYMQPWQVKLSESPSLDCLEDDDVIVDIATSGICGTDIGIINGAYPSAVPGVTIGHEASGIVARIGKGVAKFKIGDRVVINPTYACQKCRMCLTGNPNHCKMKESTEAGVSCDGTFASQYRGKEALLLKLDDHISMEAASLTEPLSCTITGVDKLAITHTNIRAGVIGAGPMGMLYLWTLHTRGVKAFLVEKDPNRYSFAQKSLPPSTSIHSDFKDALDQEYGHKDNELDLCIDTTGQITELIFQHLAPGGKLMNVALINNHVTLDIQKIADKSLSVIGSIDSLNNSFERAYIMIRDADIPVAKLISHVFDFSDYMQAFRTVGCDIASKTMLPFETPNCKVQLRIENLR